VKKHIVTLQLAQIPAAQCPAFNDEQNESGQHLILCKALFRLQDKEEKL